MQINNTQEINTPENKRTLTMAHCTKLLRNYLGSLHTCDSPTVLCGFTCCTHAVGL